MDVQINGPTGSTSCRRALRSGGTLGAGYAARIVGVHLEGPYLSPGRAGAHDPALMLDPTTEQIDLLLAADAGRGILTMVTLAPERTGATAAIEQLVAAGVVVSIGHSAATAAQTSAAADAGARMVTHLFNAQSPLGHREPGLPSMPSRACRGWRTGRSPGQRSSSTRPSGPSSGSGSPPLSR